MSFQNELRAVNAVNVDACIVALDLCGGLNTFEFQGI
jgi:hypothetical protein